VKPYYQDEWVTIYHGDCREILPQLDVKVDLVLTDPPYGINKADWDIEFNLPPDMNTDILGLMPGVWNLLKCPPKLQAYDHWLNFRWQIIAHLVNGMTHGAIGWGNYIPCLVYVKEGVILNHKGSDCKDFVVGAEYKPAHPSPKPERVIAWFVERLSNSGNLILDPFLGSGTTAYCAKKLNRKCIGIEIEEKYCEIAAKRCSQGVFDLG